MTLRNHKCDKRNSRKELIHENGYVLVFMLTTKKKQLGLRQETANIGRATKKAD